MVSRRHLLKLSALGTASFAAPLAYSASNITMTHNTGNPIGSTSPKDLSDNARNLDLLLLGDHPSYLDRRGAPRKSWKGMEAAFDAAQIRQESKFDSTQADRLDRFDAFIASSGWQDKGAYAADIVITSHNQYITFSGQPYTLSPSTVVPYTTTGIWANDSSKFALRGDSVLRQDLASSKGAGSIGFNRSPIAAAVGSLAKAIAGLDITLWEYEHLVTVRPISGDPSSWDWAPAVEAAVNENADGKKHVNIVVPVGKFLCGMVKITEKHRWSVTGPGTLIKNTPNPMISLYRCNKVNAHHVGLNGNIVWDEATHGSILPGVGRTAYAVGIYAEQCNDLKIFDCDIFDFANDPISIRGKYAGGAPGSANASLVTASERVLITGCNIYNYRNTAVYLGGVKDCFVGHNAIYTTDAFGYVRGNGIYLVDWCDGVLCFDNKMERIGDNGIGVGEVKNPLAQNRNISLISNNIDRCVYMSILVAGGEDVLVYDNTLTRGVMQRALVPEAFLLSGNPGSLQVRGGNTSRAHRVRLIANTVDQSHQRGIYVFDDVAITKANWTSGVEVTSNIVRRSQQENIYVNMAIPVFVAFNQACDGAGIGIFTSGGHDLFMNRAWGNVNHGILSSQLNTFPTQEQNPTISQNRCWDNGQNGIQVLGGALVRANPPRPKILHNKCRGNGASGASLGGKSGIRANGLYHPLIQGNECSDSYGPGILIDSCTGYVADSSNILSNNGWDTSLPQKQRAGIYVMCTATSFKDGRLMSNKMFAGENQQVGYAAEFDTTGSLICIGNEPDAHPLLPQNVARKSWEDIFNNR